MFYGASLFLFIGIDMKTILIDGDILVYKTGFACQVTSYIVTDKSGVEWSFSRLKNAAAFKEKSGATEDIRKEVWSDTFDKVHMMLVRQINRLRRAVGTDDYAIYLTSSNTDAKFRTRVAVTAPYKGNRKAAKPIHYHAIRRLLIDEYGAVVAPDELEADDMLGIEQTMPGSDTIIATIDKDLWMIPGEHISITNLDTFESEDPGSLILTHTGTGKVKLFGFGFKWFCAQMLMGDAADNIKGLSRVGPVTAYKMLNKVEDVLHMWETVVFAYSRVEQEHRLKENGTLLWIQRYGARTYSEFLTKSLNKLGTSADAEEEG